MFPRPSQTAIATCVKRESLFLVAFSVGNWDKNLLRLLFNKFEDYVQQPDYKHKLTIYSDGNDDYTAVLPEYYNKDCLCYGQKIKTKNGKKIFPAIKRKIFGNPNFNDIDTNANECVNSIFRSRISRMVRRSQCHAKNRYVLGNAFALFQFYWNFMHENEEKLTPAILEKRATKVWTWGKFLHKKLKYLN